MATSLPREMWERIVAQLPPPEPKLVPMIWFVPKNDLENIGEIYISKAVAEKEAFMIGSRCLEVWQNDDVAWILQYRTHFDFEFAHARARMLGWDYATEADRAAHAAIEPYYMTRVDKK